MRYVIAVSLFLASSVAARADIVAQYDFTGNQGNNLIESPLNVVPGLSVSVLTRGAGLSRPNRTDAFNSAKLVHNRHTNPTDYLTFTLTPAAGFQLDVTSLDFGAARTLTGPSDRDSAFEPRRLLRRSGPDRHPSDPGESDVPARNLGTRPESIRSSFGFMA